MLPVHLFLNFVCVTSFLFRPFLLGVMAARDCGIPWIFNLMH